MRPVTTTFPPLASTPVAKASEDSEPTKSHTPWTPPVAAVTALRASGSAGSNAAAAPAFIAAARLPASMSATSGAAARHSHHADAAKADQQHRAARGVSLEPLEGRIGGKTRAHQHAGERRRQRRVVEKIARMRHQHVAGITAVGRDAEMPRRGAQVLRAQPAPRAGAAADPRKDRDLAPRRRHGIGRDSCSGAFDDAGDLVAEREGQGAARRDVEPFVAGQPEVAVVYVQVGMAHAAALDSHQYLAALWVRAVDDSFGQRRPVGHQGLAVKLRCHAYSHTATMWRRDNTCRKSTHNRTAKRQSPRSCNVLATVGRLMFGHRL